MDVITLNNYILYGTDNSFWAMDTPLALDLGLLFCLKLHHPFIVKLHLVKEENKKVPKALDHFQTTRARIATRVH